MGAAGGDDPRGLVEHAEQLTDRGAHGVRVHEDGVVARAGRLGREVEGEGRSAGGAGRTPHDDDPAALDAGVDLGLLGPFGGALVPLDGGGHHRDDLLDRRAGLDHVAEAQGGLLGRRGRGAQPDDGRVLEQRGEHVPAQTPHGQVDEDGVADPGADHGGGLGEIGAAPHDPHLVVGAAGEVVDDPDLVPTGGAQHEVDHESTP